MVTIMSPTHNWQLLLLLLLIAQNKPKQLSTVEPSREEKLAIDIAEEFLMDEIL